MFWMSLCIVVLGKFYVLLCPLVSFLNLAKRLMSVWRITGKIIRTAIFNTYAQL